MGSCNLAIIELAGAQMGTAERDASMGRASHHPAVLYRRWEFHVLLLIHCNNPRHLKGNSTRVSLDLQHFSHATDAAA